VFGAFFPVYTGGAMWMFGRHAVEMDESLDAGRFVLMLNHVSVSFSVCE
jgi:hypothetical protein